MEHDTGLGHLLEARFAFHDDQGAVAVAGQEHRGMGDLVGNLVDAALVARREQPGERADPADPLERPAELRLEDDDDREQANDGKRLEDLGEEPQVESPSRGVDDEQNAHADHQADRPRPADQAEQPVDEDGGDADVDQRCQVDLIDDRRE